MRRKHTQIEETDRDDVVGETPAYEHVKTCYTVYGKSVNTDRALPSIYDGLKPVQRRVLLTLSNISQGLHNATEVVGTTINLYHPHSSDSVETTIHTLINKYKPLLSGKGNFGKYRSLNGKQPPAAMRYVKVGSSELFTEMFAPYIGFAPTFLNENDHDEQIYLPCPVPYCLLCGADGIGIGCATKIPHCDPADLMNVVKLILEGKESKAKKYLVHPIPDGGCGNLEITDEELVKFNTKGECQVTVSAKVTGQWDETEQRWSYIVTDFPENINPAKILINFKQEIDEGLVYIRDESTTSLRIVIGREKRIKRITDEEIEKRLKRSVTVKCSYRNYVAEGEIARLSTPYEMIKISLSKLIEAEVLSLKQKLSKVSLDILFELYKQDVAKELMADPKWTSPADIIARIKKYRKDTDDLTEDVVKFILSKSISTLKSSKAKDTSEMYKLRDELVDAIKHPETYYLTHQYKNVRKVLCND